MENQERICRWRLILGQDTQERFSAMGGSGLTAQQDLMDQALAAIYNQTSAGGFGNGGPGAGHGPSNPQITQWLGDVRSLFDKELVTVIQGDAINRCGLKQLLFEPELLENLEPDVGLASTILTLKEQIPKGSKDSVRYYIRKIVEQINRLLEQDIRRAVTASLNRRRHSPIPSAAALDYKQTISRNLKNYHPELNAIVPEHFYFFDRTSTTAANKWTVILDVDQSGSMGESVIYSSIMSCILASMSSLKTRIVAFDTSIVDLTEKSDDPVDLLFGFQLGGGTDIDRSIAYCEQFVEIPAKTLFFLVTDLYEGGNRAALLRRLEGLKTSGVTVICLLAIADGGRPYYDAQMAQKVSGLGIPCFACSPQLLPQLLERAFRGQDLAAFQKEFEKRKR
ncbi:MAG: VWA domain-containing protein [Oscillospiraceae bacterium]|nr:VWA domain-containing protein [Oscillospiraceae bacterium]MCI9364292.1 VWA domain-containing protein [Oscillospiraceae bacterium]MCI9669853.1 VWA domain-containing protein [Oscillospiraceae bacterium]RKJ57931.1 VWA domain-containing protein [bacterium 1XD42-8]RKJ66732.1 VWA domain-containing protein [bacterium 1XD42-1]